MGCSRPSAEREWREAVAYSIITVILLVIMLLFFCCVISMFVIGGIRQTKRPGRRVGGAALLLCAVFNVGLFVLMAILMFMERNTFWLFKPTGLVFLLCCFVLAIFIFLFVRSESYRRDETQPECDCIVVLGAGLVDGLRVTRLLAGRIDRCKELFDANCGKPYVIMSGGRGSDEKVSEASAMQDYAIEMGIPPEKIVLEERSTSTKENMQYSKETMDNRSDADSCIFITNEFHLYRASVLAKRVGLNARGVACKTTDYSWPSAFGREYLMVMLLYIWIPIALAAVWGVLAWLLF